MKIRTVMFIVFLVSLLWLSPPASRLLTAPGSKAAPMAAQKISGKLPMSFESNQGQAHPEVRFLARGAGYRLSLMPTEAVMELPAGKTTLRMQLIGAGFPFPNHGGRISPRQRRGVHTCFGHFLCVRDQICR